MPPVHIEVEREDHEQELREAWDDGRAEAAKVFPLVHQEGFEAGWAACMNMIFRRLRSRAGTDRAIRELLIELLQ